MTSLPRARGSTVSSLVGAAVVSPLLQVLEVKRGYSSDVYPPTYSLLPRLALEISASTSRDPAQVHLFAHDDLSCLRSRRHSPRGVGGACRRRCGGSCAVHHPNADHLGVAAPLGRFAESIRTARQRGSISDRHPETAAGGCHRIEPGALFERGCRVLALGSRPTFSTRRRFDRRCYIIRSSIRRRERPSRPASSGLGLLGLAGRRIRHPQMVEGLRRRRALARSSLGTWIARFDSWRL